MATTILDMIPRPRKVRLLGADWLVPPLTLGDLADLQAWVADQSWDPWDAPETTDEAERWALIYARSEHWPPTPWTGLAMAATDHTAYLAEWLWVAAGRHNRIDRGQSDLAASLLSPMEWDAVFAAAHGLSPADVALCRINRLDGWTPPETGVDWPLAIVETLDRYQGLDPTTIDRLTLPQWRMLRGGGTTAAIPLSSRPGETVQDATRRRRALLAAARTRLARESETAGPAAGESLRVPEGRAGQKDQQPQPNERSGIGGVQAEPHGRHDSDDDRQ